MYIYNSPQGIQDYDVPPSMYSSPGIAQNSRESLGSGSLSDMQNYDVPSALLQNPTYDTPSACINDTYDSPAALMTGVMVAPPSNDRLMSLSNRSSVLSVLSTGSHSSICSAHSSQSGSARSSVDVSFQDIYDVPPAARAVPCQQISPVQKPSNNGSNFTAGSIKKPNLKFTSEPENRGLVGKPPSGWKLYEDRDSYLDDYSIPRSDTSQGSGDSGISISKSDQFLDNTKALPDELYDTPRNLSFDESNSDVNNESQFYDVPNQIVLNGNEENRLYDVPHQLPVMQNETDGSQIYDVPNQSLQKFGSRDSSSNKVGQASPPASSCVSENARTSNVDVAPVLTLQKSVVRHSARLSQLISDFTKDSLDKFETKLSQIKLVCLSLKTSVKELLDFVSEKFLATRSSIITEVSDPLQHHRQLVVALLQRFDQKVSSIIATKWPAPSLDLDDSRLAQLHSLLNEVMIMSNNFPETVTPFVDVVVQNLVSLPEASCQHTISRTNSENKDVSDHKRPPPAVKPKPKANLSPQQSQNKLSQVQERPLPSPPSSKSFASGSNSSSQTSLAANSTQGASQSDGTFVWNDDCDYVMIANEAEQQLRLQDERLSFERQEQKLVSEQVPPTEYRRKNSEFDNVECENKNDDSFAEPPPYVGDSNPNSVLSDDDLELIIFYAEQVDAHLSVVRTAVTYFFQAMAEHPLPREFIVRSKFVILAAHKLVYISDAITRNVADRQACSDIAAAANGLCDLLKGTVGATKSAALMFPDHAAQLQMSYYIQEVVESCVILKDVIRRHTSSQFN